MIESFQEEALANTDVRLNHYAPSTLNDQRSLAGPTPSICSSRMQKPSPAVPRDGSISRVSQLNSEAQKRSASPQKRRQLPFTRNHLKPMERPSVALASNMHKR